MNGSSAFTLYPAIDILGGRCVRLLRGDYRSATTYGADPRRTAEHWLAEGARFLHVVDLDAARSGQPENQSAVTAILQAAASVGAKVQVGGGVRDLDTMAAWLNLGVARCVVGTAALQPGWVEGAVRRFGAEALVVGLDGRGGRMAVRGWEEQTDVPLVDVARRLADVGAVHALVTDVDRDGALTGPNLELAGHVAAQGLRAIASGGIRSLEDVQAAKQAGLAGAIAGRAIYEGRLNVREALAWLETEGATC
ncbi:MAG: 1-(5-phosphoribosyl)-5-[(5-phosphoribosylamino)methylideneamino]imidazole-4-carboxamide isomerase [Alicyclobacillus sp.]|nr:1-(5-phosphoribosyl)-5-[(5-phosphoribosylamino)methylideneamino]imidazole-4-carboxamide isomerase [Alicyclobacillus sp.]